MNTQKAYLITHCSCLLFHTIFPVCTGRRYLYRKNIIAVIIDHPNHDIHAIVRLVILSVSVNQNTKVNARVDRNLTSSALLYAMIS